jgi:hypothetical protein
MFFSPVVISTGQREFPSFLWNYICDLNERAEGAYLFPRLFNVTKNEHKRYEITYGYKQDDWLYKTYLLIPPVTIQSDFERYAYAVLTKDLVPLLVAVGFELLTFPTGFMIPQDAARIHRYYGDKKISIEYNSEISYPVMKLILNYSFGKTDLEAYSIYRRMKEAGVVELDSTLCPEAAVIAERLFNDAGVKCKIA